MTKITKINTRDRKIKKRTLKIRNKSEERKRSKEIKRRDINWDRIRKAKEELANE